MMYGVGGYQFSEYLRIRILLDLVSWNPVALTRWSFRLVSIDYPSFTTEGYDDYHSIRTRTSLLSRCATAPGWKRDQFCTFELQWGTVTVQVPSGTGYEATFVSGHVAAAAIEKSSHSGTDSMPVISHGSPATGNRWPLVLWSGQLVVVVPIVFYGLLRATNGPPLGSLILPVWLGSIVWLALVAGVLATRCGRLWIVTHRHQLLLSAMTTILAVLILGEAAIRVVGRSDEDGNFFVRGHHVSPRRLPVKRIEAAERAYRASSSAFMIEDELLGWAPRPGIQTGQYTYNAEGIRVTSSDISYGEIPRNGTIRISLFGDSFTNGAEVSDGETWGEYTGTALRERGQAVEVLNFGVNGYGMDQAYLRWRYTGIRYKPAVVVFGLQLENAKRNINLIRPMYLRFTELLPFTKPRFIVEGAELRLINSPVVPLNRPPGYCAQSGSMAARSV